MRPLTIIESPYAGDIEANLDYARKACRDAYDRGEMPFASHLLYPQFIDDKDPDQRQDGIGFGYRFWQPGATIAFYTDLGWSGGMRSALARVLAGQPVRFQARSLFHHLGPKLDEAVVALLTKHNTYMEFS